MLSFDTVESEGGEAQEGRVPSFHVAQRHVAVDFRAPPPHTFLHFRVDQANSPLYNQTLILAASKPWV